MGNQALIDRLKEQIEAIESPSSSEGAPREGIPRKKAARREVDLASPKDALSKIVALVNVSDRSEKAIRERLSQTGYEASAIDEAVSQARSYGFIDDMRYAAVLIRSRIAQGKGVPGIERELRDHGIDILDVPGWPEEFEVGEEREFDRALAVLEARPPRSKNPRESAYRKLVSKGYSSSVASSAARAWCEGR